MSIKKQPVTALALIADVQYADIDDLRVYGRMRYYRNTLNLLKATVNDLRMYEKINKVKVKHLLQVGDLIDGAKVKDSKDAILNMYKVLGELEMLYPKHDFESEYQFASEKIPKLLHIYGNHEVYILGRKGIKNSPLNTARVLKQNQNEIGNYYYIDLTDRVRLICLDLYEISPLGFSQDDEVFKKSNELIEYYKSLRQTTSKQEERDYYERFTIYNGAASQVQINWLENQLNICKNTNRKVILAGHTPIMMQKENKAVAWNSDDILKLIWSYENLVCIYFSGHYHVGDYLVDPKGIHHLTLKAILETPPLNENNNQNSYALVEIFDDQISVKYPHISSNIVVNI